MPSQKAITPDMTPQTTVGKKLVINLATPCWGLPTPLSHLDKRQGEI